MEVVENKDDKQKKLSYDELLNVAQQLSEQVQQLQIRLQQTDMSITFKRLDYLFKVLDFKNKGLFTPKFVNDCGKEIEETITVPEEEEEEDKK